MHVGDCFVPRNDKFNYWVMLSLSKHCEVAFAHVLRQAQDDPA